MNVLLAEDGQHYQHAHISDGRSLVIDIGGFTTDFLAVNPGGAVDYSLAQSVPLGIQTVLADFEKSFRANNLEAVKIPVCYRLIASERRLRQVFSMVVVKGLIVRRMLKRLPGCLSIVLPMPTRT